MIAFMKYINIISRCAFQYRNEQFADSDLNGLQCTYILYICNNPGISQEQLSKIIYINKSNVTRQLAALEENGYVERRISGEDKRVIEVYPTEKAQDILPRVRQVFYDWNRYLTEDFQEEEKAVLNSLLERVTEKAKLYFDRGTISGEKEQKQS